MSEIGSRRLRQLIEDVGVRFQKRGWRQKLAEVMGVSPGYISKIVNGAQVSDSTILELSQRIGLSMEYFADPNPEFDQPRSWARFALPYRSEFQRVEGLKDVRHAVFALQGALGSHDRSAIETARKRVGSLAEHLWIVGWAGHMREKSEHSSYADDEQADYEAHWASQARQFLEFFDIYGKHTSWDAENIALFSVFDQLAGVHRPDPPTPAEDDKAWRKHLAEIAARLPKLLDDGQ